MHKACIGKIEDLNLMADGLLSNENSETLIKHLSDCDACAACYNDIVAMKKALSSMSLQVPAGLNDRISKAVRDIPQKKRITRHIYRYATVAAACLVLAVALYATGTFNGMMKSDKSMETAELQDYGKGADDRGSEAAGEMENALTLTEGTEESAVMPAPEPLPPTDDASDELDSINAKLADYRFSTSAVENPETVVVNPGGIPLDSGFGGMQDVFYASASYSVSDITAIVSREFNPVEIKGEDDNVFFYMESDALPKLEARLGLVSAGQLTVKKDNVSVRIISVAGNDE